MIQTHFEETFGYLIAPDYQGPKVEIEESYPYLQCPYCLYGSYSLNQFIILGKKGNISKKMALCPGCHNTLRRSTLIETGKSDWEHYAYWLASSSMYDVNKRIKWQKIFDAMKPLSQDLRAKFWNIYRMKKCDLDPSYKARLEEKQIEKQAEEYAKAWEAESGMSYQEYSEKQNKQNKYRSRIHIANQQTLNSSG